MSHYTLAVHIPAHNENLIQNVEPYLEQVLMPWHEYESTGIENEYVRQVNITENEVNDYMAMHDAWQVPLPNGKSAYRYSHTFSKEELISRELTEAEKELYRKNTFQFGPRDIRIERDKLWEPMEMLSVPDNYIKTQAALCHMENFLEATKNNWGIEEVIHDMADAPETGHYIYAARDVNLGPFDIETPLEEIKNLLMENVRVYRYTNPNAKWDYWGIGGRFFMKNKKGEECSMCQIKNLKLEYAKRRPSAEKIWNYLIEDKKDAIDPDELPMYLWGLTKADLLRFPSKEAYIENYCRWRPYAYIKDGIWHEPGQMGWWACSTSTPESQAVYDKAFDNMIAACDPEDWIVCVDCHI